MTAAEFDGKTVFVVGGSMGIGLAAGKQCAHLGADVVLFARRREPLEAAANDVKQSCKREDQRVEVRVLDVADHEQVQTVMDECVASFGAPDVLLNCAGRAIPHRFEDVSYEQFDQTMRVNVYGCWNTVAALVPHMKTRGVGYIVNTSSLAGLMGVYGYTDYCASKFALVGFSEALRSELKPHGITVSVLCPPDTDTPGFEEENTTKPAETRAISAAAKLMTAEDVARALFSGMSRKEFVIIPGGDGKLTAWAKRLVPGLLERYMDSIVAKVQRRAGAKSAEG